MAGILSQQEIDSLLSSTQSPDEPFLSAMKKESDAVPFDFRLPHRLSKRQLQAFTVVHETFAEAFSSYLLSRLQTPVAVAVLGVDQMFYSQYVASVVKPSCLYVFRVEGSEARAVLELSPSLVLAIIARMLGGTDEGDIEPRQITKIEQNISKGIVLRALSDLEKAWKTVIEQTFVYERYETEGDFVQIAPASEIVLVVSFELTIDVHKYTMNVCFPTFALDDVLAKLHSQTAGATVRSTERSQWQHIILKKLENTKIPTVCILGETTLTVREVMELQPGDVLLTNSSTNAELNIKFGGKTRAYGKPGVSNGKTAVKITHIDADSITNEE